MKKKVAIIGAGLQLGRRLPAIIDEGNYEVTLIVDKNAQVAEAAANQWGTAHSSDWQAAIKNKAISIVIVATYPDSHAAITIAALKAGKHVLCEKPLAKTMPQAAAMVKTAAQMKRILKCGFNHRHHPAIIEAHRLFTQGHIGQALFGRGRYGIAGRPGIAKEWRANPAIVSGGQLMEQGIHLVDLFRWFVGDISRASGEVSTLHWPIAPLEDNAFALLTNPQGVTVSIHSSLTQWINLFSFELYGTKGSVTVEGLGGSYGEAKLITSLHNPTGPFASQTIAYRGADRSWHEEWREFITAIATNRQPLGSGTDGLKAMAIVNAVYKAARTHRSVTISTQ